MRYAPKYLLAALLAVAVGTAASAQTQTLSVSLEQCREMALQHDEDLRKANISAQRAALDKEIAFSNYLPTIDGSLTGVVMKDLDGGLMTIIMKGTYMAGINLTQPIFAGTKIINANRLAKVGQKVAEEQLRMQKQQLIADVDKSYYALMSVRAKVNMLKAIQAQLDTLLSQVNTSVSVQLATDADALRVKTKQSEILYNLQKAQTGDALCEMALCSTIGVELGTHLVLPQSPEEGESPVLTNDISKRPELAMLNSAIDAKQLQVNMAKSDYLPTVGLGVSLNYFGNVKMQTMTQLPDGSYMPYQMKLGQFLPAAMLSVQIPIFHWGTYRKVKQAKLDVEAARLDLQKKERLMTIEAAQAIRNVQDARQMVSTANLAQQQADENLRIMRLRYDAKMATLTDLLDAQSQWQQAHANLIEARTQVQISNTEYLRVTGQLADQYPTPAPAK